MTDLVEIATLAIARAGMGEGDRYVFDRVTERPEGFDNPIVVRVLNDARPIAEAVLSALSPYITTKGETE